MRRSITLALLCFVVSPRLLAGDYSFVRIDVPNALTTEARGINARGDIVGDYVDVNDIPHAFLLRKGVFTTIDVPNAAATISAFDINARGDIVGNFVDAGDVTHGFLLSDGQFTQIDFPRSGSTTVFDINNAGDISGTADQGTFVFKDGVYRLVRIPDTWLDAIVFSAQDNGRVLVGAAVTPDGGPLGFIRHKPGEFELLFPHPAAPCTGAREINQRGDIVGLFDGCDEGSTASGFVLRDGKFTRIDVPGSVLTAALGINDDGVIVGRYEDRKGRTRGFKAVPRP